jgi:hypothetical protein
MTYREALEKGVEKWERLSILQSAANEGDEEAWEKIESLLEERCSLCRYHDLCYDCVLFKKRLCVFSENEAYCVFVYSTDNNEKLTAARQIRDALRDELRRVTEEEATL